MTTTAPTSTPTRSAGPSLYKLVSGLPKERTFMQPADGLVIIGRQLELMLQDDQLPADVAIGTLRFSLFRLHQGRVAQLAPYCRSLTVYGDPDVEPPQMPGVEFVPLQRGTPLSLEWFLLVDSPAFWGALLTQAVPDRTTGNMRRYVFEGALTADERVVSRARLLLSLMRRQPATDIGARDLLAQHARWGRIVYELSTHSEAQRLNLSSCLGEFPDLLEIAEHREDSIEQLLPHALQVLRRHSNTAGELLYRIEGQRMYPMVWSGPHQPPVMDVSSGIIGQAFHTRQAVLTPLDLGSPEHAVLPEAQSAVAVPLQVNGQPWGILVTGHAEVDPYESPATSPTLGVAALLEQLLAEKVTMNAANSIEVADLGFTFDDNTGQVSSGNVSQSWAPQLQTTPLPPQPSLAASPLPPVTYTPPPGFPSGAPATPMPPAFSAGAPATPMPPAFPAGAPATPMPPAFPAGAPATPPRPYPAAPAAQVAPTGSFGLPAWMRSSTPAPSTPAPAHPVTSDHSWPAFQRRLLGALIAYDQRSAERIWNEACSLFPTEAICTELLVPIQVAIGEGWHRGEVSVAAEHFASRFVQSKLLNLFNAQIDAPNGPLAVIGCAQGELHEIGAIMLSLFLRWAGFRVVYIGQNVPNSTLEHMLRTLRPRLFGLSATTIEGAQHLIDAGNILSRLGDARPLFIFGGLAFYERPDLRLRIQGQFMEGDLRQIVHDLAAQLRG